MRLLIGVPVIIKFGIVKIPLMMIVKLGVFTSSLAALAVTVGVPVQDPWFDGFALYYVFSAITAGMPEPDENSSFFYIWMYRTFHILSANGTAYFAHKKMWSDISSGAGASAWEEMNKMKEKS